MVIFLYVQFGRFLVWRTNESSNGAGDAGVTFKINVLDLEGISALCYNFNKLYQYYPFIFTMPINVYKTADIKKYIVYGSVWWCVLHIYQTLQRKNK